ncbi:MAG: hypothetical protein AB1781_06360 [Pseudomonadota bacterium]
MSESPDLEVLAARFLELWQDQLAAMAQDSANVEIITRLYRHFAEITLPTVLGAAYSNEFQNNRKDGAAGSAARPETVAASSGGADARLAKLARRLAAVEKRLAALESGPSTRRRSPAKKTRRG